MRQIIFYTTAALLIVLTTIACDPAENSSTGTLQVMLTDAPADYESVIIDIEEVRVHISSDSDEDDDGWQTINEQPMRVDLLDLTNGNTEILGEEALEPGVYSQMRFILGDENELVIDGESQPLTTPSAQESGLKLNINADIESNSTYTLLLDFDASRSIVQAGNSGMYLLKPVIRTVNLAETGAISGDINPGNAQPWIYAIAEEDTVAGTQASIDGNFLLIGLTSGTYDLSFVPTSDELNPTCVPEVTVIAPDTTSVGTINLEDIQ
ncbi:DUF4382 domain-containing protein [Rhodohalobacter sp. 8-1]|uniref:DUF4382 domain-containing protein n=1 Tax=Rhodohalobacter sp. 8-1 TaxID=3131972 RepID=UPI0030EE5C09